MARRSSLRNQRPGRTRNRRRTGRSGSVPGYLIVALLLIATLSATGWLGFRQWQHNTALTNNPEFAFVRVTQTWYGTQDPRFVWRGPVADGVVETGRYMGKAVRVSRVIEQAKPGEQIRIRHSRDDLTIAQSAAAQVTTWHDFAPWVVFAFVLIPLPAVLDRLYWSMMGSNRRGRQGRHTPDMQPPTGRFY